MLANVGVGFIFAPYFAWFRTGQLKTMDKLEALRNESGGFCEVIIL